MNKVSILVVILLSLLSSCRIMHEKNENLDNLSKFNGFYTVDSVGYKFVYYNDSLRFEYIDTNAILTFNDIKSIKNKKGKYGGRELFIVLTDDAKKVFADYTQNNVGNKLAIIFNDKLIMAPVIQDAITGGEVVVTGYDLNEEFDKIVENFKIYKKQKK